MRAGCFSGLRFRRKECAEEVGSQARKAPRSSWPRDTGRKTLLRPKRGGLNPGTELQEVVCIENASVLRVQTQRPIMPVPHTPWQTPSSEPEPVGRVLRSLRKRPPDPEQSGGRAGHFPRPLSRQLTWLPYRAAFRDSGLERVKERLSSPGPWGDSSSSWPSPART